MIWFPVLQNLDHYCSGIKKENAFLYLILIPCEKGRHKSEACKWAF